ncbi:DNA-binding transcriptional regulator, LysR family [Pseudomonas koreensis]|uniref:LysR family transcriptional regulator n=1 Tax=Pseudomonas koreensis TaxID=198620 RepID=UPI00087CB9FB|nr:LysR family transcriptional regulator [Pseudomonas koreensis]KAB0510673.1 LysR family transcriptional regulator [Pseudomonas koreensis]NNA59608.1 LysR family transcriptional regulator [Pseudomonas koreensis]GGK43465.1 LysR family transcriptional regulator [Pseudomonas koreensis]SDC86344.1 DNA-binding transcriptional regulator, LysR family [Pseudomonas koreensis]
MDRLAAMETFVYVVETGSFSAAARRLNIGQPAVSKTIAQLEKRLAVSLLLRSTRGLTPTEAGLAYFERAKRAIDEANEADNAARDSASGLSGNLRISAAVTFGRLHVVPHLGAFLDQHPQLNIDLMLDDRNINLVEEGIDVALRLGALTDSGLTARKIADCRRVVLGTPAYFAKHGEPTCPAELSKHQAVVYNLGGGTTWQFTKGAEQQPVIISGRLRVSAAEGVREAVLADHGLTLASEWMFAPELASGAVKTVMHDWTLPDLDLWAVFPTGRLVSAKARAFVEYIQGLLVS